MNRDLFRLAYDAHMLAGNTDTAEIMLYGEIIHNIPENWKWDKEDKSAADFDKAVKKLREDGAKKLLLRINSPGGVCTEAVAMRAILANAGFEEIKIRIEGLCASAATDLATLPGAHVSITEGSEYMIHNPWTCAWGNANEIEKTIARLRNIEQMSRSFYTAKTGQSEEQIKAWMDAETWFTAEEAVENGFADELLKAEKEEDAPIAACVTGRVMAAMRELYQAVPEQIAVREEEAADETAGETGEMTGETTPEQTIVTDGTPVAGAPSEIHHEEDHPPMEIAELTAEQLAAQNPALLAQVQQNAVQAERERLNDIDALTEPGYEEMAAQAKANGTSAMDFHKQIVAAMKQKGSNFLTARQEETAPAQNIAGGAAQSSGKTEQEELDAYAKEMAGYAMSYSGRGDGSMF